MSSRECGRRLVAMMSRPELLGQPIADSCAEISRAADDDHAHYESGR